MPFLSIRTNWAGYAIDDPTSGYCSVSNFWIISLERFPDIELAIKANLAMIESKSEAM
jgi:hypothetical protein